MNDASVGAVFSDTAASEETDSALLSAIANGDRKALERLVLRHQAWIYNIAMRMVNNVMDAEDATQEILIKAITRLSTFRGESKFRTWLYRIAKNHLMSMERRAMEGYFPSFDRHAEVLLNTPELELVDDRCPPVDQHLLVEETKHECLSGRLLCLDRTQRLVFILGGVFGISSAVGSEIMEMGPANFRQVLSRARKDLSNYMSEKCGLFNSENPCRCERKTRALIERGYVDPDNPRFSDFYVERVASFVTTNVEMADDALQLRSQGVFRDMPFLKSRDFIAALTEKFSWENSGQGGEHDE